MDLISYVPRFPNEGETLHGSRFETGCGGKGANQAVAAAKLGCAVKMVGSVGDDAFGTVMKVYFCTCILAGLFGAAGHKFGTRHTRGYVFIFDEIILG